MTARPHFRNLSKTETQAANQVLLIGLMLISIATRALKRVRHNFCKVSTELIIAIMQIIADMYVS